MQRFPALSRITACLLALTAAPLVAGCLPKDGGAGSSVEGASTSDQRSGDADEGSLKSAPAATSGSTAKPVTGSDSLGGSSGSGDSSGSAGRSGEPGGGGGASTGGKSGGLDVISHETSELTMSDAHVIRTRQDQGFYLRLQTLVGGKVVATGGHQYSDWTEDNYLVIKGVCRKDQETCLNFTTKNGDHVESVTETECVFVNPHGSPGDTKVEVHVDSDGSGAFGSCQPDEDDIFMISCPESTKLRIGNCNG
jgi:hypothetical protein